MPKRAYPFEADLMPQVKVHVGQKQINNGVSGDERMKDVYGKIMCYLFFYLFFSFILFILLFMLYCLTFISVTQFSRQNSNSTQGRCEGTLM